MREIAMHSGVNTQDLRRGSVTDYEVSKMEVAAAKISKMSVFIDHAGGLSISKIKARVRKQTRIKKIDILFIDYLQLLDMEIRGKQATEESIIANTTRKLKLMAKELDIPVVALSQLNREVEKSRDKKPEMGHFKGSGAIEADADIAMLLYNPSKYFPDPVDKDGNSLKNRMEIIFAKNRQGATGSLWLNINAATNDFNDDDVVPPTPFNPSGISVTPMPTVNLNNIMNKDDAKQSDFSEELGY